MEQWKAIPSYEGLYEVSDMGQVKRIAEYCGRKGILKQDSDNFGYKRVMLSKNDVQKRWLVHVLVMVAFVGPKQGLTCNHKNGKKGDNRLENLEYLTQSDNEKHAYRELGRPRPQGSRHGMHKLTESEVSDIRLLHQLSPHTVMKETAEAYGVGLSTISLLLKRRTWRHI